MRSQIIAEEEAKEDQIQVVQDPKPNDSGFFYAKQEKPKEFNVHWFYIKIYEKSGNSLQLTNFWDRQGQNK